MLSTGDAGLQRVAKWLYNLQERNDGKYLEQQYEKWSSFESIVSLYFWEAINQGYGDSDNIIDGLVNS